MSLVGDAAWLMPGLLFAAFMAIWLALLPRMVGPTNDAWRRYVHRAAVVRDRFYLDVSAERLALSMLVGGVGLGMMWGLMQASLWHTGFGVLVGLSIPGLCTQIMWRRRMKAIEQQLEPAITLMAGRWRSSPDIAGSFRVVEAHMEPPISQEAQLVLRELRLGVTPDAALANLAGRVPLPTVYLLCAGIRHALPAGGNVARVLDSIAEAVRESQRLEQLVDTKTAQGRIQAWIMAVMPPIVVVGLGALDPSLIEPLFETPLGNLILAAAVVLDLIGVILIRRLTRIRL